MNDKKIWFETEDGKKLFIIKTEKCDMQKELTETINYLQQELQRKDNIINEVKDIINRMIYMGYCAKTGKGTTATNFMATGEQSEFGTRAKYILNKIKELEKSK